MQPLLLSAKDAAVLLGISKRFFDELDAKGKVPKAVRLGRRKLWVRDDLERWIQVGCVSRDQFAKLRGN